MFCLPLAMNASEIAPQPRITQSMLDMSQEDLKAAVADILGPQMVATINCESGFRQFTEFGTELRSKTSDVGVAQINVDTWGTEAMNLGYDIYTPIGNLEMAKYILSVQGKTAWVCYKKHLKAT